MGFLFRIVLVAAIVVGVLYYVKSNGSKLPNLASFSSLSQVKVPVDQNALKTLTNLSASSVTSQVSSVLDSLVTHPDRNSPVVLGVKITNDSLSTLVDVIGKLPPNQVNQLKAAICK